MIISDIATTKCLYFIRNDNVSEILEIMESKYQYYNGFINKDGVRQNRYATGGKSAPQIERGPVDYQWTIKEPTRTLS